MALAAKAILGLWLLRMAKAFATFAAWRAKMNKRFIGPPANIFLGNLSDLIAAGGFAEKFFVDLHAKYGERGGRVVLEEGGVAK